MWSFTECFKSGTRSLIIVSFCQVSSTTICCLGSTIWLLFFSSWIRCNNLAFRWFSIKLTLIWGRYNFHLCSNFLVMHLFSCNHSSISDTKCSFFPSDFTIQNWGHTYFYGSSILNFLNFNCPKRREILLHDSIRHRPGSQPIWTNAPGFLSFWINFTVEVN